MNKACSFMKNASNFAQKVFVLLFFGLLHTTGSAQSLIYFTQKSERQIAPTPETNVDPELGELRRRLDELEPAARAVRPPLLFIAQQNAAPAPSPAPAKVLLESQESRLLILNLDTTTAANERRAAKTDAVNYVNARVELMERLMQLMEQRRNMQATLDAYKKRLENLEKKMRASQNAL